MIIKGEGREWYRDKKNKPQENDIEARLFAAELDRHCPKLDLHGLNREDVAGKIDQFLSDHIEAEAVRIVFGGGKGILELEVLSYLKELKDRRDGPILEFRKDRRTASCVVILK